MTVQAAPTRHRRSRAVSISMAAALTTMGLAACGSSGPDHRAACVDQTTEKRVDDQSCTTNRSGFGWYFFPRGVLFPAVGGLVSGGSFRQPTTGSVSRGGLDAKGGTVSRGGFGGGGGSKSVGGSKSIGG